MHSSIFGKKTVYQHKHCIQTVKLSGNQPFPFFSSWVWNCAITSWTNVTIAKPKYFPGVATVEKCPNLILPTLIRDDDLKTLCNCQDSHIPWGCFMAWIIDADAHIETEPLWILEWFFQVRSQNIPVKIGGVKISTVNGFCHTHQQIRWSSHLSKELNLWLITLL